MEWPVKTIRKSGLAANAVLIAGRTWFWISVQALWKPRAPLQLVQPLTLTLCTNSLSLMSDFRRVSLPRKEVMMSLLVVSTATKPVVPAKPTLSLIISAKSSIGNEFWSCLTLQI
jgi:hypothetical protein